MKTDLFQSCGHCWVFQICWHIECNTFTPSSSRIWNSSTGIPSPPLASFIVMLSKAHLTSHSKMSGLENFERYFASMWDEWNCVVVWAFFCIAFLWDWNETDLFHSCGHCWLFQICWPIECSTFTASSFRIWNSSTGILSPPLALFIVMLSKAHLTSHSKMSGSRLMITSSWL